MLKLSQKYSFILIAALFSMIALDASALNLFGSKLPKAINYQVFDSQFEKYASLSKAQNKSLLALESVIRGIANKKIQKKLGVSISEAEFPGSENFVKPLQVANVVLADNSLSDSKIAGIMEFSDDTGRSVKFWFDMNIEETAKHVNATVLALEMMIQANPKVELFVVPDNAIDTTAVYAIKDYKKLYEKISNIAVNKRNHATSGQQEYTAVAFYKELIAPDMKVRMKIANTQDDASGLEDESRYALIEDTWLVTVLPFYADLTRDNKWIKITMQSKANAYDNKLADEYVAGLFSLSM